MGLSQFDERFAYFSMQVLGSGTTPGAQNIAIGLVTGLRIDHVWVATDSLVDVVVQLELQDTYGEYSTPVTIALPAGAGYTPGVPSVDILAQWLGPDVGLVMPFPSTLVLKTPDTLVSTTVLTAVSTGGYL